MPGLANITRCLPGYSKIGVNSPASHTHTGGKNYVKEAELLTEGNQELRAYTRESYKNGSLGALRAGSGDGYCVWLRVEHYCSRKLHLFSLC